MSTVIKVCDGHACKKNLSQYTFDRAAADLGIEVDKKEKGITDDKKIVLEKCACQGKCAKGPTVGVQKSGNIKYHEYTNPVEMGKIIKNIKT